MAENNILTDEQKRSITKLVTDSFAEDLQGQLQIDLINFMQRVNHILSQMKLIKINKKWEFFNYNDKMNMLAAEGYLLIFNFRQFLLGEEIDYRYYFFDGKEGASKAVSFSEKDILKYIKFGSSAIQLDSTSLKKATAKINVEYSAFANHYFTMYTVPEINDYMRLIKSKNFSGRKVRKSIMDKYGKANPGLKKKGTRQYQFFNRGHIYEAIDSATSEILKKEEYASNELDELMEKYVFGKYLIRDNIKASKGGDNPITNTSIKSMDADLYDYSTIRDQLIEIKYILSNGLINQEEISKKIEDLFLEKTKFSTEEDYEKAAEKALNKLLDTLKSNKKS